MRSYTAVVERCADTGFYVGYVPGFPGAHSQGETLDELNELMGTEYCTRKYDLNGGLLLHIHEGGNSLVVDPFDGSIWMTNRKGIIHLSSTGEKLGVRARVLKGQKWLVLIPGRE